MKLAIQYLNDSRGKTQAVQIPLSEWEKVVSTMKKYEQLLKIKSDLKIAFSEVEKIKRGKIKKHKLFLIFWMGYKIIATPVFKREAKRLLKRFASLKEELADVERSLQNNPVQGTPLGHNVYKVRLAIKSKGKGKSGGARIITYVITADSEVFLLSIYDKSEISSIDDKTLKLLIAEVRSRKI